MTESETKFQHFDVLKVKLEGQNLIEASAGTGKTYSIAVLVLRLLLEKKFAVREILMVTFTKAAVAELEERIRLFIRNAYRAAGGDLIEDDLISGLVENAISKNGHHEVLTLLKDAVLFLDETAVLTIHGFCQTTLSEFAFETGQLFGTEILLDTSAVLKEQVNIFWREHITSIPVPLLEKILQQGFDQASIENILKAHLDGKKYIHHERDIDYMPCLEDFDSILSEIQAFEKKLVELKRVLIQQVTDSHLYIENIGATNANIREQLCIHLNNPQKFLEVIWEKHIKSIKYIDENFQDLVEKLKECEGINIMQQHVVHEMISKLRCLAINKISEGIESYKKRLNVVSFDDMIERLHSALGLNLDFDQQNLDPGQQNRNPAMDKLIFSIRNKYKAVFIDEFQDTDRLQYEIFHILFQENTILFYIADPKQSIYGWRQADIHTYFEALNAVQYRYNMNVNFRSSEAYIKAMNYLFKPNENFDTFSYSNVQNSIEYTQVYSPDKNEKGNLRKGETFAVPLTIYKSPSQKSICSSVAALVNDLLDGKTYSIEKEGKCRFVRPSDIGILVRRNKDAKEIKNSLSSIGIPSVTIDDSKVLQSDEARQFLLILEGIQNITPGNINRALLSSFTAYDFNDLLYLDDELSLANFRKYKLSWEIQGIYKAMMEFSADYNIKSILLTDRSSNGERIISNFFQLVELVHQIQTKKEFSPLELISWLKRSIQDSSISGDEYEQRIESDEETVKIVTIHNSKGLEYNIVLAPFLDFNKMSEKEPVSFRDDEREEYITADLRQLSESQINTLEKQNEQENRRLFYVAITRAVYACYIFRNTFHKFKDSTLNTFLKAMENKDSAFIKFSEPPEFSKHSYATIGFEQTTLTFRPGPVQFALSKNNWRKMSFSMLSEKHQSSTRLRRSASFNQDYERFIFHDLPWGQETGNMLHYIFENVHFNDPKQWQSVIRDASKLYSFKAPYSKFLELMLDHVLNAQIQLDGHSFKLSDVSNEKQIHEFEFDFNVEKFRPTQLNSLSKNDMLVSTKFYSEIEGIMNGKIDLFFEHKGKYYILDWKSNYLGDSLENYSQEGMSVSMNENNYHLQYLIYSVAVKKYLESRLLHFDYESQFGGVIYLFIRGIRKESELGIFTRKLELQELSEMEMLFIA